MKRFVLGLVATMIFAAAPASAIETDKIAHFSTSYVACDLFYKTMEFGYHRFDEKEKKEYGKLHLGHRIMVAAFINLLGHAKELGDSYYDKGDIRANALGSALWLLKMQIRF